MSKLENPPKLENGYIRLGSDDFEVVRSTDKATLFDFEGDEKWIPKSNYKLHEYQDKDYLDIKEWFYDKMW